MFVLCLHLFPSSAKVRLTRRNKRRLPPSSNLMQARLHFPTCGTMRQPRYSWDDTGVSHRRRKPLSSESVFCPQHPSLQESSIMSEPRYSFDRNSTATRQCHFVSCLRSFSASARYNQPGPEQARIVPKQQLNGRHWVALRPAEETFLLLDSLEEQPRDLTVGQLEEILSSHPTYAVRRL